MKLIDKSAIVNEIKSRIKESEKLADVAADNNLHNTLEANEVLIRQYTSLLSFLNTLEVKEMNEEPVSEYLEEAAFDYAEACKYDGGEKLLCVEHFKAGAQWQKQKNALETKEVDLEKKIQDLIYNRFFDLEGIAIAGSSLYATVEDMAHIAKHFFELGLNTRKGE